MHPFSSRLRSWLPVFALALAAPAGCDDPADFADDGAVSLRPGGGGGCIGCSLNSPTVNDALITELNLDGVANASGVTFVDIFNPENGHHYKPDMNLGRDELIARSSRGSASSWPRRRPTTTTRSRWRPPARPRGRCSSARASTWCCRTCACPAWTAWRCSAACASASPTSSASSSPPTATSTPPSRPCASAFDYLQKPLGSLAELRLLIRRAAERRALRNFQEAHQGSSDAAPELTFGAPAMQPVVAALRKVAVTDATVLLIGQSGTGKEIAARAVHGWSRRQADPFVAVNCAALAEQLLESELFGHEKGAFTGAHARRRGRIEVAQGGTFFLDEVGELALPLQAKLLRLLQERTFERLGGGPTLRADVRWIAATNRDLPAMIAEGRFREDLFHRLAVFPVVLPPLRDRREDIEPLAERLLAQACANLGRKPLKLDASARALLRRARWSGNVRELANTLERAAILADGDSLHESELAIPGLGFTPSPAAVAPASGPAPAPLAPAGEPGHDAPPRPLQDLERDAIEAALRRFEGNRIRTAEALGIGVRTLYDKIKRYGLGE